MTKRMLWSIPGMACTIVVFGLILTTTPTLRGFLFVLAGLLASGATFVYLGSDADYWEERYRTHRNCGNRS